MGLFRVRRNLVVNGGSVQIGADVGIYRSAANRLDTDDALQVAGTANLVGAVRHGGALTQVGAATMAAASFSGSAVFSGTPVVLPYGTVSPGDAVNGEFNIYHRAAVAYLSFRSGGTPYSIALPNVTAGTMLVTVGSPP